MSTSPPARSGLGAAAPLFAAVARRYVDAHFGERPRSRFIALLGDAELDEGNIWEAVFDPVTHGLGNVMWVVDFNRQSLDRVVPGVRIAHWRGQFEAAGWHVVEAKYGRRLQATFAEPDGEALRAWITTMPNEHYQSLFGLSGGQLRERFLDGAPPGVDRVLGGVPDAELASLVTDLGGHDLASMLAALRGLRRGTRPAQRDLRLHGQGLGAADRGQPAEPFRAAAAHADRRDAGQPRPDRADRMGPVRPVHRGGPVLCSQRREALRREPRTPAAPVTVPAATGCARHPAGLHAGDVRPDPGQPVPRRGAGARTWSCPRRTWPPRPTWPASSTGSGCSPGRTALVARGLRAALGRGAGRAAHRARHLAR